MKGVLDFGRQSSRQENLFANERLSDRFKLNSYVQTNT